MKKFGLSAALVAVLVGTAGFSAPSRPELVRFLSVHERWIYRRSAGGGEGVLTFRGRRYPFTVSGMSVGFTLGASANTLVGRAVNTEQPGFV